MFKNVTPVSVPSVLHDLLVQRKAILGPDASDDKHTTILNRLITYHVVKGGGQYYITMDPDPRHAEILVRELGLGSGSKAVTMPMEKTQENFVDTPLEGTSRQSTGACA